VGPRFPIYSRRVEGGGGKKKQTTWGKRKEGVDLTDLKPRKKKNRLEEKNELLRLICEDTVMGKNLEH